MSIWIQYSTFSRKKYATLDRKFPEGETNMDTLRINDTKYCFKNPLLPAICMIFGCVQMYEN